MYVCMFVCMYACMYVCMYIFRYYTFLEADYVSGLARLTEIVNLKRASPATRGEFAKMHAC